MRIVKRVPARALARRALLVLAAALAVALSLTSLDAVLLGAPRATAEPRTTQPSAPRATSRSKPMTERTYVKPADAELRKKLTPLQYEVTQHDATEPPFRNAFHDNHEAGLYVDVVTGEPLFSSTDKFESGTGWPSFTRPIEEGRVVTKEDRAYGMRRVEVRSKAGSSHLGHVFDDGPAPTGQRFCMNSLALRLDEK